LVVLEDGFSLLLGSEHGFFAFFLFFVFFAYVLHVQHLGINVRFRVFLLSFPPAKETLRLLLLLSSLAIGFFFFPLPFFNNRKVLLPLLSKVSDFIHRLEQIHDRIRSSNKIRMIGINMGIFYLNQVQDNFISGS